MKKMITSPQVHFFVLETIKQRNELSSLNKANTSFKRKNEILFYPPFFKVIADLGKAKKHLLLDKKSKGVDYFNRLKRKVFVHPFTILSRTICKDKPLFFPYRVITSIYREMIS